jgi:hypothetical protein
MLLKVYCHYSFILVGEHLFLYDFLGQFVAGISIGGGKNCRKGLTGHRAIATIEQNYGITVVARNFVWAGSPLAKPRPLRRAVAVVVTAGLAKRPEKL